MEGAPVKRIQEELVRKYSWVRTTYPDVKPTGVFDTATELALREFQHRAGLPVTGIADWRTQVRLGIQAPAPAAPLVGTCYSIHGTGVTMWDGPPADTARGVADLWFHQPIWYPAQAFPMGQSVQEGRRQLGYEVAKRKPSQPWCVTSYSQGSMVWTEFYLKDVLPAGAPFHAWLPSLKGVVTFGAPNREKGKANGNIVERLPIPEGQGIADIRMKDTPDWWLDFAHGANCMYGRDLYTDIDDSDWGEMCTAVYRAVQDIKNIVLGTNSLLEQIGEMMQRPTSEVAAAMSAVLYAGQFFTAKPFATYPHCSYKVEPAVNYLRGLGMSLR